MGKQLTEMLKGTLEGIVLAILSGQPAYGYEITARLREQGFTDIAEGTVYAVLVRIEQRGLVDVEKVPSEKGPPRKVYTLNAQGRAYLDEFWTTWGFLRDRIEEVRVGVFDHPVAAQIEIARNKAVAHYEISHDGNDWKTWRIGETRLTYGALSEFVDRCSDAIEFSTLFILRGNITFAEFRNVAARYAAEYVEALALGMRELTKPEAE